MSDQKADPVGIVLVVVGVMLPLAGFLWGPGQWWQYLLWLAIGTAVVFGYASSLEEKSDA